MRVLDGAAQGIELTLRRCPMYLRMVQNRRGVWDALDQLEDEPKVDETVYVYRRKPGTWMHYHVRSQGSYESADYEWYPAPTDLIRKNEAWREWCLQQPKVDP